MKHRLPVYIPAIAFLLSIAYVIYSSNSIPEDANIFDAVKSGDQRLVGLMLEQRGELVNQHDERPLADARTPLHYAIEYRRAEIIGLLIQAGADVNRKDAIYYTPLMYAVLADDLKTGRLLLAKGARVDDSALGGYTALMLAAERNQVDMMQLLVAHGADINACTDTTYDDYAKQLTGQELTALTLAAGNTALEAVEYLLTLGAPVNGGETTIEPLRWAAENNALDAMRLLLAGGARVDGRPEADWTPLMSAANDDASLEAARLLIDNGANVNFLSPNGYTALMSCVLRDADAIARLLLEHGADVNARFEPTGDTALLRAVKEMESGDPRIFDVLLTYNADVNIRDNHGHTALYYARRTGRDSLAQKLLRHGAVE